jgi:hypothetical protein
VVTPRRFGLLLALAAAPACKPDLHETPSLVTGQVVLAVRSNPPDVLPRDTVTYDMLLVDQSGAVTGAPFSWDFCDARKPLAELGPVSTQCLAPSGDWLVPIGRGTSVSGALPEDVCMQFGPDVPMAVEGQPQGRPVDPDPTGGYYAPVRATGPDGAITLVETRLICGLSNAPANVSVDYQHRYHANANPAVESIANVGADGATSALVTADAGTNPVGAGDTLALRVSWSAACPTMDVCGDGVCGPDETNSTCSADCTTPVPCTGAERFVVFDVPSQSLIIQRESIATAWYATAGSFDNDRTGRDGTDLTTSSDNTWHTPKTPGLVHLWAVLRDNRGGVGWAEYVFDVR